MKKHLLALLMIVLASPAPAQAQASEADKAVSFMSYLSSKIVSRPLTSAEVNTIRTQGVLAFASVVTGWSNDPAFAKNFQLYVQDLSRMNGQSEGIDYNLPGYLGLEIAKKKRPYAELITSNTCYDAQGTAIACDTQAPFTAGLLTTRAYMAKNKGAFNISRAGKMTSRFLCTDYPLPDDLEPRIPIAEVIPTFATTEGKVSFGNGTNCYSCHGQFGLHTQLFVKFDLSGFYNPNANGLQVEGGASGFSTNSTATSHFKDPARASKENSRILGRNVANLAEAAQSMAQSPHFYTCAVKNLMRYYLRLSDADIASIKPDLYIQIANQAKAIRTEPSPSDLLQAIITNASVYSSFTKSGALP